MRPKLTKRACDECITRKVKCSGAWPCDTCRSAPKQVKCTYLKPARRRGPKVRRHTGKIDSVSFVSGTDASTSLNVGASNESHVGHRTISRSVLETVVHWYQHSSYSVWPVIDAEVLLRRLADDDDGHDTDVYCLATALCAATMAQLQLPPLTDDGQVVDCVAMASECMRLREESNYRENLDMKSILVSFFLHVYHAKINKRNSAMMFIQEAISGARLLKLDEWDRETRAGGDEAIANEDILFTLLWVSERGYAMHLGLLPSYTSPIRLPEGIYSAGNEHAQGLLELAKLFAAFDSVSLKRSTGALNPDVISTDCLTDTEAALSMLALGEGGRASVRMADYCITKEWMRTIIWQEALSRQMLSSKAYSELLTFKFPTRVSRDLLYSLQGFSEFDLLPLGRDQLLKCFEVTNSLADVVLYTPSVSSYELRLGPQDFLHALYQKLLPFLEQDAMLKSILHAKTAEALVTAPARLLRFYDEQIADDESTMYEYLDRSIYDTAVFISQGLNESS
ncbi:C6 transcription factor [Aspergillus nomiae NRRL 13137]|uniref:C6 transcription factor n=1 Tax=Aspergillus nomiae NRRL (strain ATCC 15546 / NRRL 13137 / CBS 260.88 / M93) TaxID=1509407 RepID=A0A0L1J5U4_ASPN3|nr:C6 transcription factor [Aspergillus nomiae NRRL 13137]KNG86788.1 C6 transcription factor [Aspergillus nomiae NRRL 13137]